ncbi:MAG: DNA polymerase III subunit beta [Ignavibacteria bacterium]
MKFNISVEQFVNALTKLNLVIPSHSTLPILDNIMFDLKGNELTMLASDLEIFIRNSVKVEGLEDGEIAMPAKKLLDLARLLVTKFENVIASVDFEQDVYYALNRNEKIAELLKMNLKYELSKNTLIYKGIFTLEEKDKISEILNNEKNSADNSEEELKGNIEILIDGIDRLYKEAENISKKMYEKRKIKIDVNEKNKVTITSKNGKYTLFGEPVDDFPIPEDRTDLNKMEIKSAVLKRFLMKVRHSVKYDEIRRNMAGVFFDIKKEELRFVATDGFRLSKILTKNFSHNNPKDDNFIVPLKTCEMILKLCNDGDSVIEYDNNLIKVIFDNLQIYSKLIDDTFPNYETVIPKENDKRLKIFKSELQNSLRRALIFADVITKRVKFEIKNDSLMIKADNPEIGAEGEEIIEGSFVSDNNDVDFDKEPFVIAFNVGYLLDCLAQMETPEVIFSFNTPAKASIIIPTEQLPGEDFMELIMPVRVS